MIYRLEKIPRKGGSILVHGKELFVTDVIYPATGDEFLVGYRINTLFGSMSFDKDTLVLVGDTSPEAWLIDE